MEGQMSICAASDQGLRYFCSSTSTANILLTPFLLLKLSLESCRRYHIQHIKLPKEHHDKTTVNVYVYKITRIDALRHTTKTTITNV